MTETLAEFMNRNRPTNYTNLSRQDKLIVDGMLATLYNDNARQEKIIRQLWGVFLATDFSERNLRPEEEADWETFGLDQIEEFLNSYQLS